MTQSKRNWRDSGVRIVRSDQLDLNTPQTPGMTRAAAINRAMAGANKLWAGTVRVEPDAKTGPHHRLSSLIKRSTPGPTNLLCAWWSVVIRNLS